MAKKITQGVGMMAREITQHDVNDPGGLEAFLKALDRIVPTGKPDDLPGEALDRKNAERCREILATVGLKHFMDGKGAVDERPLIEKKLGEDTAQYLAAHWLGAYNRMMAQRQRLLDGDVSPSTIGMMLMHAQDLGRLQERMWWRAGVHKIDPHNKKTWVRREALALTGLPVKKGQQSAAQRTNAMHSPTRNARMARMSELVPLIGVDNAAAQCEFEGLGGWQAIKRQWNRHKKRDT